MSLRAPQAPQKGDPCACAVLVSDFSGLRLNSYYINLRRDCFSSVPRIDVSMPPRGDKGEC